MKQDEIKEAAQTFLKDLLPYHPRHYVEDRAQVLREIFAGFSVAMTVIGEGIAFAFILHVEPQVALHASWIVGLITALLGSRLGMINGADGVRAAALGSFIYDHGVEYLFPIVLIMSVFFVIAALLNFMRFVRMIPTTVMSGFVNGLAIIIFIGQVAHFEDKGGSDKYVSGPTLYWMLFEVFLTIFCTLLLPCIPKVGPILPGALIGMGVATFFDSVILQGATEWSTPTIGSVSNITDGAPIAFWQDSRYVGRLPTFNWDMFTLIIGPAFFTSGACFVETAMTMEIVDDLTRTKNDRPRQQILAMALANLVAGLVGTMGGAALVPETIFSIVVAGSNGKYRISGFVAAIVILIFVFVAQPFIRIIPTASIVGIMLIVCYHTFDWASLPIIVASAVPLQIRRRIPLLRTRKVNRFDALVVVVTTIVVVLTNLFIAVLAGVLMTSAAVVWESGERLVIRVDEESEGKKVYIVEGSLLFSATKRFISTFDPENDPNEVIVEFRGYGLALQDLSAINALNVVGKRYEDIGKSFRVHGIDDLTLKRLSKAETLRRHFVVISSEDEPTESTVHQVQAA